MMLDLPLSTSLAIFEVSRYLKAKYPQINPSTSVVAVESKVHLVQDLPKQDLLTAKYALPIERSIKDALYKELGMVINDRNYLLKLVRSECRKMTEPYIVTKYELTPVIFHHPEGSVFDEVIHCCYIPETDELLIKR